MGLDDWILDKRLSESERALDGYWNGKIDKERAWEIASVTVRTPKLEYVSHILPSHLEDGLFETKEYAVKRVKNVIRLAQKVFRVRDQHQLLAYKDKIRENEQFSADDHELCLLAFDIFNEHPQFSELVNNFKDESLQTVFSRGSSEKLEDFMRGFNQNKRRSDVDMSIAFLHDLANWTSEHIRHHPVFGNKFNRFSDLLNLLSREMWYGMKDVYQPIILSWEIYGGGVAFQMNTGSLLPYKLHAKLNSSLVNVMSNNVNCCITGPHGKHREAALLYWLDSAVHTWEIYSEPKLDSPPICYPDINHGLPFGLGIFVQAEGRHHTASEDSKYLIFEGFPADTCEYGHIEYLWYHKMPFKMYQLTGLYSIEHGDIGNLPALVYSLGLLTARKLGCTKLFINTSHSSHTQFSVSDTLNKMAKFTENAKNWDSETQSLIRDPQSHNGAFGEFIVPEHLRDGHRVKQQKFKYTHFLRKAPLPNGILEKIRGKSADWNGEGFFDTFHEWTRFAGNTYDWWRPEDKNLHPYALRISERVKAAHKEGTAPESYWNLGTGYCKGFEVDVEKECKRLGIS